MSVDYNYRPTEVEQLEGILTTKLDEQYYSMDERLSILEATVNDSHVGIENIKKELNAPFTKGEGLILFFGGIGGNILIAGLLDIKGFLNGAIFIGAAIVTLSIILWIYLFFKKL